MSEDYIRYLVESANKKMTAIWERLDRFRALLQAMPVDEEVMLCHVPIYVLCLAR